MNPFLEKSKLQRQFDDALPFDLIKTEHFEPAFELGLTEARQRLYEVASSKASPTFQNTVEALEFLSESLDQVSAVFSNLLHANTSPLLQALAKTLMPKLSEFSNDLFLNPDLFKRAKVVFENMSNLGLSNEQRELVKKTYRHFLRNGALLDEEKKKSLRKIDERLSLLGREFSDHVLQATQNFFLPLIEESDFLGLPDWYRAQCQAAGKEREQPHPGVTLDAPLFVPFLKFSSQRSLREKVWRAYQTRAISTNTPVMTQIATLRLERANLLGYPSHTSYVLEERMAEKPERLAGFFEKLIDPSLQAAKRELEELEAFAKAQGHPGKLERWDLSYYSEKLKEAKFKLQEDKLRPYFPLESVIQGVFETANRLYGLKFMPRKELPVYHPDVQVFEVRTSENDQGGRYIGLLYADFFPRPSKQGGAWMTTFRDQGRASDGLKRPHVSIVCNFTKPSEKHPSLLDLNEVRTLFHEFGHALHALLSDCEYKSLSGANVYWDFVELPSQIMENWTREESGLRLFAHHFESGEPLPSEMFQAIQASSRFQAGLASIRQLQLGILDLAWHSANSSDQLPKATPIEVEEFEKASTGHLQILPWVGGTSVSASFTHIFSGGYSAGYYSYKWAEVLDADAFEFFKEQGIFNREVAEKFRHEILSRGGTEHPAKLYRNFRGRDPDVGALLRRDGLLPS